MGEDQERRFDRVMPSPCIPAATSSAAINAFIGMVKTAYQTGTPDGKRPGRVSVAVSDYASPSFINDEAAENHEAIPGHHMQLSLQADPQGPGRVPQTRRQLGVHRGMG